jgi:hypothetical protein
MSNQTYFDILGDWCPSPGCVRRDKRLKPTTRLVYIELVDHARLLRGKADVFPGIERIAESLGLSEPTVKRAFAALKKYGLITRTKRGHTSTLTTLMSLRPLYGDDTERSEFPSKGSECTSHERSECTHEAVVVEAVEEKKTPERRSAVRVFVDSVLENWNSFASENGFAQSKGKPEIRKKISARFKDEEWQGDFWPAMLEKLERLKPFYRGDGPRGWKLNLAFLVKNGTKAEELLNGEWSLPDKPPPSNEAFTDDAPIPTLPADRMWDV